MFASWKGHREEVVALLDAGADPNLVSGTVPSAFETVGGTPPTTALRQAIGSGHNDIARVLMTRGAKVDAGAAVAAAAKDDLGMLEELEKRGVDWNEPCSESYYGTPLRAAAAAGNRKNLDWLLRHGAHVNLVTSVTALKEAVDDDDPETVRFLLDQGADPNIVYWSSRETALFTATTKHVGAGSYEKNREVIRLLLKHGADRNHRAFDQEETVVEWARKRCERTREAVDKAIDPVIRQRLEASLSHEDAVLRLLLDS